jgi:hypothetical protein
MPSAQRHEHARLVRLTNRCSDTPPLEFPCLGASSFLHYDCETGQKGARVEHFLLTRDYLLAGNDFRYASTASASAGVI